MKPLHEQFASVARAYEGATLIDMGCGIHQIRIPRLALPTGWSAGTTEIRFVVPNGYPYAAPDCFWADATLRLKNGALPQNAHIGNTMPGQPDSNTLWFSWHLQMPWNPSICDLMTYVNVIRRRFEEVQ
jgi:hypothetical protein